MSDANVTSERCNFLPGKIFCCSPANVSVSFLLLYLLTANNGLAGRIPSEITGLEKLDVLGMEYNMLIGPIPSGFADGLYRVRLSGNNLSGPMPIFPPSVLTIELDDNRLSGPIDNAVANLPRLKKLNVHGNRFTGGIPASLGTVSTEVKEIRLHDNLFRGVVPADLCIARMQNFNFKRLSVDCKAVECECCAPECPFRGP